MKKLWNLNNKNTLKIKGWKYSSGWKIKILLKVEDENTLKTKW